MNGLRWIGALVLVAGLAACGGGSAFQGPADGPAPVADVLLASYELGEGIHMGPLLPEQTLDVVLIVGHHDLQPPPTLPILTRVDISPVLAEDAVPRRYVHALGDDAELDAFLARLANGQDDDVGGGWRVGEGLGFSSDLESIMLENRADWLTGPDLMGANITRLVVDVTQAGRDAQNPDLYTAHATVSIYGTP